jgi:short-subunit dehydrogenase
MKEPLNGKKVLITGSSMGIGTCYVGFVSTAPKMDPASKKF